MKLPRWLMISMWTSIALGPLVAVGWLWVNWPEWTARRFADHIENGRFVEAAAMIDDADYGDPLFQEKMAEGMQASWGASRANVATKEPFHLIRFLASARTFTIEIGTNPTRGIVFVSRGRVTLSDLTVYLLLEQFEEDVAHRQRESPDRDIEDSGGAPQPQS